jgi:uncharacterized repeat protein (TIGR03803 family)
LDLNLLFSFQPSDTGNYPAGIIFGRDGLIYGATEFGGSANYGTIFSLAPPTQPGGAWTETVLYNFAGDTDGANPEGVVLGPGGVLYGATSKGGIPNQCGRINGGCGTVFSLTSPGAPGGGWTESVIHRFVENGPALPGGGVLLGPGGTLMGVGTLGEGTVYALLPHPGAGGQWPLVELFALNCDTGPCYTGGGLLLDGTTLFGISGGGTLNGGTVYSLTPPAN